MTWLLAALVAAMFIPFLLGSLVLWHTLILPKRPPADSSNRIGHLRLVWFALRAPESFVIHFPWLAMDEGDFIKQNMGKKQ